MVSEGKVIHIDDADSNFPRVSPDRLAAVSIHTVHYSVPPRRFPLPSYRAGNGGPAVIHSSIITGDARVVLRELPSRFCQTVITSPPYWSLRDYSIQGQIGLEDNPDDYVDSLVQVFEQVRRVLADNGTLWLNIGDSYTSGGRTWRAPDKKHPVPAMTTRPPTPKGLKPKELVGIPWRLAFALQEAGWYLRSDTIWYKPNAMPESVKDRPTRSHEYLFLLTKSERYYYDPQAVRGVNDRALRTVWGVHTQALHDVHFATFPESLIEPCVLLTSRPGDVVLDPFFGSGTTGIVAIRTRRPFLGIELNPTYVDIARRRIAQASRLDVQVQQVG